MTDPREQALRFKALRDQRAQGPLSPEEEREFQRLGQSLRALRQARSGAAAELPQKKVLGDGARLRGHPLPGCDFFDDFPELYRREVFGARRRRPPAEDEALPRGSGTVRTRSGEKLQGQVIVDERIHVAGQALPRSQVMEVHLSASAGAKRGQGLTIKLTDGRVQKGYLVSGEDEDFLDLLPLTAQDQEQTRWLIRRSEVASTSQWG
ncbi:MAG: hypothetical protein CMH55_03120 [Myxococcales bacterium]|nr:hypothetical protein [Myxococcales bacterium]